MLIRVLRTVLVIPLTTNLDRSNLAGTATIGATKGGLPHDSVALAFQLRAVPKTALISIIRPLTLGEIAEVELATDEALGRIDRDKAISRPTSVSTWRARRSAPALSCARK